MLEDAQPCSLRACSRDDPECGARRGVLRRRLVTARPGRLETRRASITTRLCSLWPKTATVERREASVPRHGTQGASLGAWRVAIWHAARVFRRAPERLSALRPPSLG